MENKKTTDRDSKEQNEILRWMGFGLEFGGVIIVFCYIGYKIDAKFNSSPYFLLTGFFVAFIGMLYTVIKQFYKK